MDPEVRAAMIVITCGLIGIFLVIMLQMMYTDQLFVNELISGTITLRVIQVGVMLFWLVIGVVLSVITR